MQFMLHHSGVKLTQTDLLAMPWKRAFLLASMVQEFGDNIVEDK